MEMTLRIFWLSIVTTGIIFSGCQRIETRKEKYENGRLKARWEVTVSKKKGVMKNGVYEEFWPNKKRKCIVNYHDNKPHGIYRSWYENKKMKAEINFLNGLKDGDYKEWWSNGKKKRFAEYKEGVLHGPIKTWDENGKLSAKGKFKTGKCKSGDCGKIHVNAGIQVD